MIGKFCGSALPEKIQSSGMFMKVVFRTDHSIEHSGFQAVYYATKQLTGMVCKNLSINIAA
jgi:hypothetical protein